MVTIWGPGRNKLRIYSTFEIYITGKSYVEVILPKVHWNVLAEFKYRVIPIRTETGQYENVNDGNILCLLCNGNAIENEDHVILKCGAYNYIWTDLFTSARSTHPNFDDLTDDDKLSLIFANAGMVFNSAKVYHQTLSKKETLNVQTMFNCYIIYYQLWHIFILTVTFHIVTYSLSYLCRERLL